MFFLHFNVCFICMFFYFLNVFVLFNAPDADRVVRLHSDNFYKKFPITFGI